MAERIKGITVEIGGDTQGLNKALKATNSEIRGTQSELKQVERLLKLDPTNVDLLKQKQELLSKAVGETETKLDSLKKAKAQADADMKAGTQVNQEEYRKLVREIASTEQSLDSLKKEAAESNSVLAKIGETAGKVAEGANKVAQATKGLSVAAAGAIAGIGGMAYKAMTLSDDLNTLAKQSGFTTEELQKMQYAADRIDVSMETITGAAAKMKKNMVSSSATVTDAWDQLGISVTDADGNLRDSNEVFYEAIAALSKIENETERDVLAMALFGKSADELAGIIDDGGAALQAMGDEAEDLGLILDQDTLDNLNAMNDEVDKLKAQSLATLATSGAKAAEVLFPLFQQAVEAIGKVLEWIGSLDEGTIKLILTVLAVVAAISPIAGIIGGIAGAISTVMPIITTIITTIGILPIAVMAVIAAIVLFGDTIQAKLDEVDRFLKGVFEKDWTTEFGVFGHVINAFFTIVKGVWDGVKTTMNGIIDFVKGVFSGDWERAWLGVQEIFGGIFSGLVALAKAPLNAIIGLLNAAIDGLNGMIDKLNNISWTIPDWVPKLGGTSFGFDIPNIPHIPALATGGVVGPGGVAVVGEAGPELLTVQGGRAVVQPMGRQMPTITMNNTFNGYDSAAGAAAARDLASQINRALGGVY